MFTGIIEEVGTILDMKKTGNAMSLVIQTSKVTEDVKLGDSIAVNGVCLTVNDFKQGQFTADVMLETMKATSLGTLKKAASSTLKGRWLQTADLADTWCQDMLTALHPSYG